MTLNPTIAGRLRKKLDELKKDGKLLSKEKLKDCYSRFRDRFGPKILSGMNGKDLLETMHAHGNRDNLVYWLEFKNDDELPPVFGSISGGSALKFGIYRAAETGEWMTGNPRAQETLSVDQAIERARRHLNEIIKGCEILEHLPGDATDDDYRTLQESLDISAPSVSNSAWGHKYFHMLFPDKLDDFHSPAYQRFHLIKMLMAPPGEKGRYICGGRYVAAARELGVPMNHLTYVINEMNGNPYQYWRVGTRLGGKHSIWELMLEKRCVAVGWDKIEDLTDIKYDAASKERIREMMQKYYNVDARVTGKQTQQLFNFVTRLNEGDIVLACDGEQVLGIGQITGPYYFERSNAPHRHRVEWLSVDSWKMPLREGLQTTLYELKKHPENRIEIEQRLIGTKPADSSPEMHTRLSDMSGRIYDILERKRQVILYGPPGTGKTYWAERAANEMVDHFNKDFTGEEMKPLAGGGGYVRLCCFHPSYGYEDFMEGYRPVTTDGRLNFELRDGIFKKLCNDASSQPDKRFYLLIDEINRGDIPRIFGELLTVLEKTKRGKKITLPVSGEPFSVPQNVYVIGTMNTADRSIALLDTALRRRFGFIELMPNLDLLKDVVVGRIPVALWLKRLNQRICDHVGRDARNLQIGHTYFLDGSKPLSTFTQFARVIREDIIPLLEEYCYEDYALLRHILGPALIPVDRNSIREELFDSAKKNDLIAALLESCSDIAASIQSAGSETNIPDDDNTGLEEETDDTEV